MATMLAPGPEDQRILCNSKLYGSLDQPGIKVPRVSTHDSLGESKQEFASKNYSGDSTWVVRQLKVNLTNPKEYYLFDEWDIE